MKRRYLVPFVAALVLLLALGALPQFLASGDPYYLTATPADGDSQAARSAVNLSTLSEQRYPYVTGAVADGESDRYRKGPLGFKGAFAHSPFDEFDALGQQYPNATEGDVAYVAGDGTVYRVTLERGTDE